MYEGEFKQCRVLRSPTYEFLATFFGVEKVRRAEGLAGASTSRLFPSSTFDNRHQKCELVVTTRKDISEEELPKVEGGLGTRHQNYAFYRS